jgi:CRISPR system Cascade subunit CasD
MAGTSTLLLRLSGPMQSWGTQSRFTNRDTGREPFKSGVIGLLCAALGRPRSEAVDDLAALRLGVRVDREGAVKMDYHTAGGNHRDQDRYGVATITGELRPVVSHRAYLSGAEFLVGLEGDIDLLRQLHEAVERPHWAIFLGRKGFAPGAPVQLPDGVQYGTDLDAALLSYRWPLPGTPIPPAPHRPHWVRLALESDDPDVGDVRTDQPVGAAFQDRVFAQRFVETRFAALGYEIPIREET